MLFLMLKNHLFFGTPAQPSFNLVSSNTCGISRRPIPLRPICSQPYCCWYLHRARASRVRILQRCSANPDVPAIRYSAPKNHLDKPSLRALGHVGFVQVWMKLRGNGACAFHIIHELRCEPLHCGEPGCWLAQGAIPPRVGPRSCFPAGRPALYQMRRNDPKVETIRELISLPSETEALLRAFALKSLKRRATPFGAANLGEKSGSFETGGIMQMEFFDHRFSHPEFLTLPVTVIGNSSTILM